MATETDTHHTEPLPVVHERIQYVARPIWPLPQETRQPTLWNYIRASRRRSSTTATDIVSPPVYTPTKDGAVIDNFDEPEEPSDSYRATSHLSDWYAGAIVLLGAGVFADEATGLNHGLEQVSFGLSVASIVGGIVYRVFH